MLKDDIEKVIVDTLNVDKCISKDKVIDIIFKEYRKAQDNIGSSIDSMERLNLVNDILIHLVNEYRTNNDIIYLV